MLAVGVVAVLVGGFALVAWALTPEEACADLYEIGTNQVNSPNSRLQAEGQQILDAADVLCQTPDPTTSTTTTTTTASTTTTAASSTTTTDSTTTSSSTTTTSTTTTTVPSSTTTTESPPTATTLPASNTYTCNRVMTMSQGKQVFDGIRRNTVNPSSWEGQIKQGSALRHWENVNFSGYAQGIRFPCADRTDFRVIFIFDPAGSDWPGDIYDVVDNIRFHFPEVDHISFVELLGVDGHGICPPNQGERSTQRHNDYIDRRGEVDIAQYGGTVSWGLDLHVSDCAFFYDQNGHITEEGEDMAAQRLLAWYEG